MVNSLLQNGSLPIGEKNVPFTVVTVQERFRMHVPQSFHEDGNLSYRYSYYSNKEKSPLGIAIRFAPVGARAARDKMVRTYFSGDEQQETSTVKGNCRVLYRESVNAGSFLSIYLVRFAVELEDGVLLGCFNCSAQYLNDWRGPALAMLQSIERL